MASSKVVTTNTDLPRQSSVCPLSTIIPDLQPNHNSKTLGSVSMDDLLKSIYSEPNSNQTQLTPDSNFHSGGGSGGASISRQGSLSLPEEMSIKTVDEVWKEIVEGSDQKRVGTGEGLEEMTLEDFLTKAGAVREEDVRGDHRLVVGPGNYGVDAAINGVGQFPIPAQGVEGSSILPFGNGIDGRVVGAPSATGRGKRRAVEEPLDKATQQKQKRMIKNRESAARSRERKQAYTVELESLVTHLEEENARLLREEADENKERLKQEQQILSTHNLQTHDFHVSKDYDPLERQVFHAFGKYRSCADPPSNLIIDIPSRAPGFDKTQLIISGLTQPSKSIKEYGLFCFDIVT